MIVKASKAAAYVLLALLLLMAALAGGAVWRLYQGPMSLSVLSPLMHRALNSADLGVKVDFADTVLTWDRREGTVEIRATEVSVRDLSGAPVASVPEASVALSLKALLSARIAPTEIKLIDPALQALRREDGSIVLVEGAGGSGPFVASLIAALQRPAGEVPGLKYFRVLSVSGAALSLDDLGSGATWRMPAADIEVAKRNGRIEFALQGPLSIGDAQLTLDIDGNYSGAERRFSATANIENLVPSQLPPSLSPHAVLKGLNADFSGYLALDYPLDAPPDLSFELVSADGSLESPDYFDSAIAVDQLNVRGAYAGAEKRLTLESVSFSSSGLTLTADGLIVLSGDGPEVTLIAQGDNLSVAQLKKVWPVTFKPKTRRWIVDHILDGRFDNFTAEVDIDDRPEGEPLPAEALVLRFRFSDLAAAYISTLPPIENGNGYGVLDMSDLNVTVESATTAGLTIPEGHVHIDDLSIRNAQDADIEVVTEGLIADALRILDQPPLGYPSKFGIRPESVLGRGATRATFRFPLIDDLQLEDVSFAAASMLEDVELPDLFKKTTADDGEFLLRVNAQGLEAEGRLSLNGVPFQTTWTERFGPLEEGESPSRYTLKGTLNDENWAKLDLPFDPRVSGDAPLDLRLVGKGSDIAEGRGYLDLTPATVTIPEFAWRKEGGAEARVDFTFHTEESGIEVTDYAVSGAGLEATGAMSLDPDFAFNRSRLSLDIGETRVSLDVFGREDGGFEVFADGDVIDIRPILAFSLQEREEEEPYPRLIFNGQFDRAIAHNDVGLSDMVVSAEFVQGWWEGGSLLARVDETEDLAFMLEREGSVRNIQITGSDAGRILKGLDFFTSGEGGELVLEMAIDDSRADSLMTGRADVRGLLLRDAPVMARMLTLASFTGIADTLSGEGIRFDRIEIPFSYRDGILNIDGAGAYGPAMGLTVEGRVDRPNDEVDLGGSIIPSYTLNSLLGKIPIIGRIFSGKEGEGLIGFTYRVTGKSEDPSIAVNPLSALAPGFLRGLFSAMNPPPSGKTPEPRESMQGMDAPVD